MNLSMFSAAAGAKAQQTRLDVVSNNLANLQTDGYKTQVAAFVDLVYQKYDQGATEDPDIGAGSRVEKTDFLFDQGGANPTGGNYDFCIDGEGFFAVFDRAKNEVYYTRNGSFRLSNFGNDIFFLTDQAGNLVLDKEMNLISVESGEPETWEVGVFDFNNKEGLLVLGENYYQPVEKNGNPIQVSSSQVRRGVLETSNVELSSELVRVIESQRAYQMALKMIQTTDEVEQTINSLRA